MTVCGMTEDEAYTIYLIEYSGDLEEDKFKKYYHRAAAFLSSITRRKTEQMISDDGIRECCAMAAFNVCEMLDQIDQSGGALSGGIVSETNDGISVTYAASKDGRNTEQRLYGAAAQYLASTGLLYRGVY